MRATLLLKATIYACRLTLSHLKNLCISYAAYDFKVPRMKIWYLIPCKLNPFRVSNDQI